MTKWALPTTDLVTDTSAGVTYWNECHKRWAVTIWILMVCPLAVFCIFEFIKWSYRKVRRRTGAGGQEDQDNSSEELNGWNTKHLKLLTLLPITQPFMHGYLGWLLFRQNQAMTDFEKKFKEETNRILQLKGKIDRKEESKKAKSIVEDFFKTKEEQERTYNH